MATPCSTRARTCEDRGKGRGVRERAWATAGGGPTFLSSHLRVPLSLCALSRLTHTRTRGSTFLRMGLDRAGGCARGLVERAHARKEKNGGERGRQKFFFVKRKMPSFHNTQNSPGRALSFRALLLGVVHSASGALLEHNSHTRTMAASPPPPSSREAGHASTSAPAAAAAAAGAVACAPDAEGRHARTLSWSSIAKSLVAGGIAGGV